MPRNQSKLAPFIGLDLRNRRVARGLTQSAAAKLIGTYRPVLSRVEHGHLTPSIETLEMYARAYGCSVSAIVSGAEELALVEAQAAFEADVRTFA